MTQKSTKERSLADQVKVTGKAHGAIDGWTIYSTEDDYGAVRKTDYYAIKGVELKRLDFSPYRAPSHISVERLIWLGCPDRSHVPSMSPLTDLDVELLWLRKRVADFQKDVSEAVLAVSGIGVREHV